MYCPYMFPAHLSSLIILIPITLAAPPYSYPYPDPIISPYSNIKTNSSPPLSPTTQAQPQPPYPFKNGTNPSYPTATASGSFISTYPSASLNLYPPYLLASGSNPAFPSAPYALYRQASTTSGVTPAETSVDPTHGAWASWWTAYVAPVITPNISPSATPTTTPIASAINANSNTNTIFLNDPVVTSSSVPATTSIDPTHGAWASWWTAYVAPVITPNISPPATPTTTPIVSANGNTNTIFLDPEEEEEEAEQPILATTPPDFDPTFGILDGPPPTPPAAADYDEAVEIAGTDWPDQLHASSFPISPSPTIRTTPSIRTITPTLSSNPIITTSPSPANGLLNNIVGLGRVMKAGSGNRIAPIDLDPAQSTVTRVADVDTAPLQMTVTRTVVPLESTGGVESWTFTLDNK